MALEASILPAFICMQFPQYMDLGNISFNTGHTVPSIQRSRFSEASGKMTFDGFWLYLRYSDPPPSPKCSVGGLLLVLSARTRVKLNTMRFLKCIKAAKNRQIICLDGYWWNIRVRIEMSFLTVMFSERNREYGGAIYT